jgi:hypothetical protein
LRVILIVHEAFTIAVVKEGKKYYRKKNNNVLTVSNLEQLGLYNEGKVDRKKQK